MTDWNRLEHAYGAAGDVPPLLASLAPEGSPEVWDELWSRLCHQGTVYSASFAALPSLAAMAEQGQPAERVQILSLAGAILCSDDVAGNGDDFMRPADTLVSRFASLCRESLALPDLDPQEFVYLLQAGRAFAGDRLWGQRLDQLADGELSGSCPHCHTDLYIVIGEDGCFVTSEDWVRHPDPVRTAIAPEPASLTDAGR